jgi:hypothetical protein
MPVKLTITWDNPSPDTIWNRLAAKLGREPTNREAADEVRRILKEASDRREYEPAHRTARRH